jgi:tripartite motif-containing protein 9/67
MTHRNTQLTPCSLCFQTELSQNLQQLSEKARSTTEFIQRLKGMTDKVNVSNMCNMLNLSDKIVVTSLLSHSLHRAESLRRSVCLLTD